MKHLENTPWYICNENDENLCAYVDTDSNYFNAEPLLKHLYPNFEELSDEEKDNILRPYIYNSNKFYTLITELKSNKSKEDILNIINNQASRSQRKSIANYVIEYNSSKEELKSQVIKIHQKLLGIKIDE